MANITLGTDLDNTDWSGSKNPLFLFPGDTGGVILGFKNWLNHWRPQYQPPNNNIYDNATVNAVNSVIMSMKADNPNNGFVSALSLMGVVNDDFFKAIKVMWGTDTLRIGFGEYYAWNNYIQAVMRRLGYSDTSLTMVNRGLTGSSAISTEPVIQYITNQTRNGVVYTKPGQSVVQAVIEQIPNTELARVFTENASVVDERIPNTELARVFTENASVVEPGLKPEPGFKPGSTGTAGVNLLVLTAIGTAMLLIIKKK